MHNAASWLTRFPGLASLNPDERLELEQSGNVVRLPSGQSVFGPGDPPASFILLVSGTVRVQQVSENGRELVLYRVRAGESCILTTACLLANESQLAEGVTETDVEAIVIPRLVFDRLVARSGEFRQFVFSAFGRRLADLCHLVEEVAFARIDVRLAQRLLALAGGGSRVELTHQELAGELGTTREVISRQLEEFKRRGWIAQARGVVDICDKAALAGFADLGL